MAKRRMRPRSNNAATRFYPDHAALRAEIDRLRAAHPKLVLYDCHSIRSVVPRLFDGTLPVFNLGTNSGASADPALTAQVEALMAASGQPFVVNGRFKGGWITRHHGRPAHGVHALQMELAFRAYLHEPATLSPDTWPAPFDPVHAQPTLRCLQDILTTVLRWARG